MARKYTLKEMKGLINRHNKSFKKLEASFLLPRKFRKNIQACVNKLYVAGDFSADVMGFLNENELNGKQTEELIKLLYLRKRVTQQARICETLLVDNKDRITRMIKEASVGANAISWLLSSSKKKQASEKAYEELLKEAEGSDYWTSAQRIFSLIDENDKITAKIDIVAVVEGTVLAVIFIS